MKHWPVIPVAQRYFFLKFALRIAVKHKAVEGSHVKVDIAVVAVVQVLTYASVIRNTRVQTLHILYLTCQG